MMDALINDKPEFVKLFVDNGANISEFLTYSRLQRLYCSISQKCLLYELLLKKHEESKLTLAGLTGQQQKEISPLFTLSEVSRVLKDFLHDACKGFYQDVRHGGKNRSVSCNFPSFICSCTVYNLRNFDQILYLRGRGTKWQIWVQSPLLLISLSSSLLLQLKMTFLISKIKKCKNGIYEIQATIPLSPILLRIVLIKVQFKSTAKVCATLTYFTFHRPFLIPALCTWRAD